VQAALQDGSLDSHHYAAYIKMRRELVDLKTRTTAKGKADSAKAKKRNILKQGRKLFKEERNEHENR
jgi:hypothetical protein